MSISKVILKSLLALILLGGAFAGGWFSRGERGDAVTTKTQVVTNTVERLVTQKVTETTKSKNGEVVTRVSETKTQDKVKRTDQDEKVKADNSAHPANGRLISKSWSLGVLWRADRLSAGGGVPAGMELGRRLFSDLWLTGTADFKEGSLLIGFRYEF